MIFQESEILVGWRLLPVDAYALPGDKLWSEELSAWIPITHQIVVDLGVFVIRKDGSHDTRTHTTVERS
jgi:hypothetical protein